MKKNARQSADFSSMPSRYNLLNYPTHHNIISRERAMQLLQRHQELITNTSISNQQATTLNNQKQLYLKSTRQSLAQKILRETQNRNLQHSLCKTVNQSCGTDGLNLRKESEKRSSVEKENGSLSSAQPMIYTANYQPSHAKVKAISARINKQDPLVQAGPTQYLLPQQSIQDRGKKTLVLDLDETLVHSSFDPVDNPDIIQDVELDGTTQKVYVQKRLHCEEFILRMSYCYEIVMFTAKHCTFYNGLFVKDLAKLGRNLSDVIMIDNSPASYLFQKDNGLPCQSWYDDKSDRELNELIPILEKLARVKDVRSYISKIVDDDDKINYHKAREILNIGQLMNPEEDNILLTFDNQPFNPIKSTPKQDIHSSPKREKSIYLSDQYKQSCLTSSKSSQSLLTRQQPQQIIPINKEQKEQNEVNRKSSGNLLTMKDENEDKDVMSLEQKIEQQAQLLRQQQAQIEDLKKRVLMNTWTNKNLINNIIPPNDNDSKPLIKQQPPQTPLQQFTTTTKQISPTSSNKHQPITSLLNKSSSAVDLKFNNKKSTAANNQKANHNKNYLLQLPITKSRSERRLSQTFVSTDGLAFNNNVVDKYSGGVLKTARCVTKDTELSIINEIKDHSHLQYNTERSYIGPTTQNTDHSASKNLHHPRPSSVQHQKYKNLQQNLSQKGKLKFLRPSTHTSLNRNGSQNRNESQQKNQHDSQMRQSQSSAIFNLQQCTPEKQTQPVNNQAQLQNIRAIGASSTTNTTPKSAYHHHPAYNTNLDKSNNNDRSGSKNIPNSKTGWLKPEISFNINNEKVQSVDLKKNLAQFIQNSDHKYDNTGNDKQQYQDPQKLQQQQPAQSSRLSLSSTSKTHNNKGSSLNKFITKLENQNVNDSRITRMSLTNTLTQKPSNLKVLQAQNIDQNLNRNHIKSPSIYQKLSPATISMTPSVQNLFASTTTMQMGSPNIGVPPQTTSINNQSGQQQKGALISHSNRASFSISTQSCSGMGNQSTLGANRGVQNQNAQSVSSLALQMLRNAHSSISTGNKQQQQQL